MADRQMTNLELLFDELLQCMICFTRFTNPKILQCGHSFCEECLQRDHNANQPEHRCPSGNIPCPTCRELTLIPENGITGLRNDFRTNKIEEILQKMNVHSNRNLCHPCKSKELLVIAKIYCVSCNVSYCDECHDKHSANQVLKDHTVIDVSMMLTCKVRR